MFVLLQTEQLKELKQEFMKQEEQLREVKKNSTTLERKLEYERYVTLYQIIHYCGTCLFFSQMLTNQVILISCFLVTLYYIRCMIW